MRSAPIRYSRTRNGTPPDETPPGVSGYGLASHTIRDFTIGGPIAARVTRGTKVSYTLSEAGTATFTVKQALPGRKKKSKCVKPTRKNRKAKKCTRLVTIGSFTRPSTKGRNSFTFTGRIRGKGLKPGSYRLVLVAKDAAGNKSKAQTVTFKVVK